MPWFFACCSSPTLCDDYRCRRLGVYASHSCKLCHKSYCSAHYSKNCAGTPDCETCYGEGYQYMGEYRRNPHKSKPTTQCDCGHRYCEEHFEDHYPIIHWYRRSAAQTFTRPSLPSFTASPQPIHYSPSMGWRLSPGIASPLGASPQEAFSPVPSPSSMKLHHRARRYSETQNQYSPSSPVPLPGNIDDEEKV